MTSKSISRTSKDIDKVTLSYAEIKAVATGKAVYQDVCYPVTKEFREVLYGEVIDSYNKEKSKSDHTSYSVKQNDFVNVPDMEEGLTIR